MSPALADRVLINCANLHRGGGVQAAASVVFELQRSGAFDRDLEAIVSSEVAADLRTLASDIVDGERIRIFDTFGMRHRARALRQLTDGYDTVLTLFGPLYRRRPRFRSIVGFAQAWIVYPRNECYEKLSSIRRLLTRAKFMIQASFFKRSDVLIVELDHVKQALVRELGINPERIHVIRNSLSSIYLDQTCWMPLVLPSKSCDLVLGYVGRNYVHKNTSVFPEIASLLEKNHAVRAKFYVTFTDQEWQACAPDFREACVNVGPLAAAQCPQFYQSLDGVVFPSLLECFSATPLEAMVMEKPLFATDRPFNRDVCGEHAHYFDPEDLESLAAQIARVFRAGPDVQALRRARRHALEFSNPKERAERYLSLLKEPASAR